MTQNEKKDDKKLDSRKELSNELEAKEDVVLSDKKDTLDIHDSTVSRSDALETKFVIIGREKDSFIESYIGEEVVREIDGKDVNLGEFFLVVEVLNRYDDGEDVGEVITETFRKKFYQETEFDGYTRFEEALKEVNRVINELEEKDGLLLSHLNMAIGVILGNDLYLSQSNDAEVYLVRNGMVNNISEGLCTGRKQKGDDVFENIASGSLQFGDLVLFSSARVIRYISQNELGRSLYGKDLDESLDILQGALRTEILGRLGVIGIKYLQVDDKGGLLDNDGLGKKSALKSKFGVYFQSLKDMSVSLFTGNRMRLSEEQKKKNLLIFGVTVLGLLLLIYLLFTRAIVSKETKQKRVIIDKAIELVESAKLEVSKDSQISLLKNAEEQIKTLLDDRRLRTEANEALKFVRETKQSLDNITPIKEPVLVADVTKGALGSELKGVMRLDESIYAYDEKNLYEIIAGVVKSPIPIFSEGGKVIKAVPFTDFGSIVFMTEDGRIREYADGLMKQLDTEDAGFQKATFAVAYGPRLYLLDQTSGQIWKYRRKREVYSGVEAYFDIPAISNPVAMAIDGSVYLIDQDGVFYRYYAGEESATFAIEDEPMIAVTEATDMYTDNEINYLYVLEPKEKRVLEYFKDLESGHLIYTTQYVFETLDDITGFFYDSLEKRLYVTDKTKLYSAEVKH